MTIVVLNAIDEIPQVNVSDLVIQEELPVGTVIGWNLTVLDPDTNDTLSYKIEGIYFVLCFLYIAGYVMPLFRYDLAIDSVLCDKMHGGLTRLRDETREFVTAYAYFYIKNRHSID